MLAQVQTIFNKNGYIIMLNLKPICIILEAMFRLLLVFTMVFLFTVNVFPADLLITAIEKNNNKYDITFDESFQIRNISLINNEGKNEISFPVYAGSGKSYRQFGILKRDYRHYLNDSIANTKTSEKTSTVNFKLNKFSITGRHKTIRAFASVIFDDEIEVECRIMEGRNGLWTAWPANKYGGEWISEFVFLDKQLKSSVEAELINTYNKNKK